MSAGEVKPGSVAKAMQWGTPTADSSMPPTPQGVPAARNRSWVAPAFVRPPTRPGLMFTKRHEPRAIACRARSTDVPDQIVDRIGHAEVGADRHHGIGAAEDAVERFSLQTGVQVPPGEVEAGLGEGVALEDRQELLQLAPALDVLADEARGQPGFR